MSRAQLVSVALASFNGEKYLEQQLRSILSQERAPDEVVVSDGGSTDGTVELAREILDGAPEGIRTELIADDARLGVGPNFARAIAGTRGQLIALSDQDDVWHPDRLGRIVGEFADPQVLLASGNARLVNAEGAPLPLDLFASLGIGAEELAALAGPDAFGLLIRRNLVTGETVAFRRTLLEAAEPFPSDWVHDEWLAILAAATGRIVVDRDPLIDYRQHDANEIGVATPTTRNRIGRMLEPRGDRYVGLERRARSLLDRLEAIDAPDRWRELARRKADFEVVRAGYDRRRIRRLGPVLRGLRDGSYAELSSQRRLDIARDLLQPE